MRRLAGALLLAAVACSRDASTRSTIRDSAGIAIAENPSGVIEHAPVWIIDGAPSVSIGEVAGDTAYQLFRVLGAARLGDGRIALLNAGTHELRFYDATGRHLRTVGRNGDGPGEFRLPAALLRLPNDSLRVWDRGQNRMTVFTSTGDFVRTVRLEAVSRSTNEILGVFGDGSVAIAMLVLDVPLTGFKPVVSTVAGFGMDGTTVDTIGTFPWREIGILFPGEDMIGSRTFAPRSAAAVHGDRLWFGTSAEPSIELRDRRGTLTRIVRWDAGDRRVAPGDAAKQFDATSPSAPQERRVAFASVPVMDRFPAHGRLVTDSDGNLWVERFPRPLAKDPTPWLVFDVDGRVIARVSVPPDFRILEIGEQYVLGLRRDAEGVERVVVHPLQRR